MTRLTDARLLGTPFRGNIERITKRNSKNQLEKLYIKTAFQEICSLIHPHKKEYQKAQNGFVSGRGGDENGL
jgi:hypothetical protein